MSVSTSSRAITPGFIIISIAFAVLGTLIFMAAASLISGNAKISYDSAPWALAIHVGTVIPALILGGPVLLMKKGTPLHKTLGRIWASLMIITSISSFWPDRRHWAHPYFFSRNAYFDTQGDILCTQGRFCAASTRHDWPLYWIICRRIIFVYAGADDGGAYAKTVLILPIA
jgi:hypothetical protein